MSILSKEVKRFAEGKGLSVIEWRQFFGCNGEFSKHR